ncbi:MAG: hypothetical protein A2289_19805 [Deltaproteobacteria bacterium RIFOXYA12_FULL_58_15]|nr:MAG: hypothetical protein A2289_19805 [Deltaproteobacteria bacterium RIFOXYA12_FULL_58_15]OGR14309.1 MAG: hypothetical protein A2341_18870 [Deltaproteobacteria bacterium RIFOXYB12_FULL_58_9]
MRTAIIIPARLAATRLPNKLLQALGDRPLIACTAAQARKCKNVDEVVVATDDESIKRVVEAHGGHAVMTDVGHASGTDRVAEAAAIVGADLVVNLQGDEPFIHPLDLEDLFQILRQQRTNLATLATPITEMWDWENPNVVKVVCRDDGQALYFSRAKIPFDRDSRHGLKGTMRHIGVYGYQRDALNRLSRTPPHPLEQRECLEQLRALALGMSIAVVPSRSVTLGIDTAEDLARARARVQQLGETAFP